MKKTSFSILVLLSVFGLAGCGPDLGLLKKYVVSSPRNQVAVMPFSMARGARDVRRACETAARDALTELGFTVVEPPAQATVTLISNIEKAAEGKRGEPAVYRQVTRTRTDANGRKVTYQEDILKRPAREGKPHELVIKMKLVDVASHDVLWTSSPNQPPADWTLEQAARYEVQRQVKEIAETYAAQKL